MKEATTLGNEQDLKNKTGAAAGKNEMLKKAGIVGAIALIAFLIGFLPMWLSVETRKRARRGDENSPSERFAEHFGDGGNQRPARRI